MHTTNYFNTLIEIAEDCPATAGVVPPIRGNKKSVANLQFELLQEHPYEYTSDDLIFGVFAERNGIADEQVDEERARFFAKGQPCLRTSPLAKSYGWGIHSDDGGKVALIAADSVEYQALVADPSVAKVKAMRSKRK
ncbi:MAG: hypothetical protein KDE53_06735 [Caldilineaceae bacterium]|nr:hypothetical protein [Caldilineaceae bacterium]MCB0126997.1 hypothetical protein [Caldilineaceae bacterium]MCB0187231.1 hypothetical protein [Caldilineaceae bacterium]